MAFRYIAEVKEGARKTVRMLPETARKGEMRRKAIAPIPDGRSRWWYQATFLMDRPTGFWQSIAVPRMEDRVSRETRKAFLAQQPKRPADGVDEKEDDRADMVARVPDSDYPSGKPLNESGQKERRNRRPKSLSDGKCLCWGPPATRDADHRKSRALAESMG